MAFSTGRLTPLVMLMLFTGAEMSRAEQKDDVLPPPPDARQSAQTAVYQLSLVINYYDTGLVVPVTRRGEAFIVSSADLQRAGIPTEHLPPGEVDLSRLEDVTVQYDGSGQRLLIAVPRDWLAVHPIAFNERNKRIQPMNGRGALVNYDFYASQTEHGAGQASLWHELRFFDDILTFSSTGNTRQKLSGDTQLPGGYIRYDTTLSGSNDDNATTWSAGDVISDALNWSNSVRVGGIYFGRDFSLRPDLVTWPMPDFSGEAAVPTSVDLFIDGYRSGSTQLQPGPFTLTNLPYINGAGNAVLVTTDALGRQVSTTLPFYVASEMLKPGISDGAFTFGALRQNYGIENFDYGPVVGSASYRYGINDYLTLETHGEGAGSLALGGAGGLVKLGRFGIVNTAYSRSQMQGNNGGQLNWGYQYSTAAFSIATQHTRRDRGFGNLALYDQPTMVDANNEPIASLSQRTDQYSLALNMGDYGNLGAAWIGVRSFDSQKTELLNLSWSRNLWRGSSIYLAASRDMQKNGWTVAMSLQIPLGDNDGMAISTENTPDAGSTQRINYSHSMPTDGGFSWNMAWARQAPADNYQQATLGWRNNHVELQGGGYGEQNMMTWWGEAMGSLVMMDDQFFAANKINDAFVVVSTDGHSQVPVNYENQPVGKTNDNGYLLISGVSAWYPGNYSIDTLDLPADTQLKATEKRVALRRNSGYLLEFPMEQERVASVILHDEQGKPLPLSSQVWRASRPVSVVGYEGITWLENLSEHNEMRVTTPEGKTCHATFTLPANPDHKLHTYGPLVCKAAH
ncbi:fimbria/pilus outer membrane usher protein [Trabulsiella odontotermitis]|uniref:fimbria/pilus outer membrane usher protein n=1 Tax=Trabulsiella odontotermitis TaxID=379893 RepID=UPI0024B73ECC|nr:fimbria/pilus outer membrane usher protein [Trabulsiella odontotermitis]WHP29741.1 fimbria/pilus outer membrane usher protein [Trabulsiella odontotermitis]